MIHRDRDEDKKELPFNKDGTGDELLVSGNGEEDRLLCHGGRHGFGGKVDDKLLRDRGKGK
eukprot:CAMPEP_0172555992 /NCGR_PEP_ID=MMETSP1067-20121228/62441_1 /TAXON_ID=265564 ORGANISM="Thalassiosira punctigera, Strain Tpunct2005C2" /NCGR_SAMPLE_ID=MMETSP1067 /ASSEMBLY_ACC=CAM_ASM_000444 /LENGTH=60 /DNA_ID=CAMNT_0013344651 /DNA_START=46 /DNA_END=225 /DNA_ORIENTATION=-